MKNATTPRRLLMGCGEGLVARLATVRAQDRRRRATQRSKGADGDSGKDKR